VLNSELSSSLNISNRIPCTLLLHQLLLLAYIKSAQHVAHHIAASKLSGSVTVSSRRGRAPIKPSPTLFTSVHASIHPYIPTVNNAAVRRYGIYALARDEIDTTVKILNVKYNNDYM